MKNLNSIHHYLAMVIASKLVFVFVLLSFASCEKDDMSTAPAGKLACTTSNSSAKLILKHDGGPVIPLEFLTIDHHSIGLGDGRDYKVVLFDDGSVLFQGRAKVAYLGDHVSHISLENVNFIRNMFIVANFFNIQSAQSTERTPFVETTFTDGINTATVKDLNNGIPQLLLQIRDKAEEKMNISEFLSRSPVAANNVAAF